MWTLSTTLPLIQYDIFICFNDKFFIKYLTGEYSCLKVDLLFKREFSYYLIQIYTPCCMLVIVSWVSFWLDQGAVPARVSLGVTTLLTMATQTSGINASLPPVSYTKAIDVWTGVCLTFVFGALLEFALVNYASRSGWLCGLNSYKILHTSAQFFVSIFSSLCPLWTLNNFSSSSW